MPRYARKHQLFGSLGYHIFNRSNAKAQIFFEQEDYWFFIGLLQNYSRRFNLRIYHWVIMPNHYHLLVEIDRPEEISKAIAGINLCYTRYHHKVRQGTGYLWQGRFKSQPIQKENYLIACGRYIERNPVRAGIVQEAKDYAYSSARFYCFGEEDSLTTESSLIREFGPQAKQRRLEYRKFLLDFNLAQEVAFRKMNIPCADKLFIKKLIKIKGHYFPKRAGRPSK